ncbi:MAG: cyanophycinase [Frankiales bacterium]|nr:cyanophycinase [Frankiales bacterium]
MSALDESAALSDPPGRLIVIGGAEDKLGKRTVLSRFVLEAGGKRARIVVMATASALGTEVVDLYRAVFTKLGAAEVLSIRPETRTEAQDAETAALVADATAVFMTGGNQLKLAAVIGNTAVGRAIHRLYDRGGVVGGTSAGASIVSEHMIAFGAEGTTPRQRMGQLSAGLGLLPGVIVDQHFTQRNRIGRLLAMVAVSPSQVGIGVDEDTAAVIDGHGVMEVVGRGAVTVVDGSNVTADAWSAKRTSPLLVSGVVLHSLPAGAIFDLRNRVLVGMPMAVADPSIEVANRDVAALSRRIAAEGAYDTAVARSARRRARKPQPDEESA